MWIYQIVLDFRLKMISEEKDGQKKVWNCIFQQGPCDDAHRSSVECVV
jgi:hypothetical protein